MNIYRFDGLNKIENLKLAFLLIFIFSVARIIAVYQAIVYKNSVLLSLLFFLMAILSFLILNADGRVFARFKWPKSPLRLFPILCFGAMFCLLTYILACQFYGLSNQNWFVYIASNYPIDIQVLDATDKQIYFAVFAVIAVSFSPLGEELFYRGLIHGLIRKKYSELKASFIDACAFAFVHLMHFGIIYTEETWTVYPVSGCLWLTLMFAVSLLFNFCKNWCDSIWGAILAHAGFNLVMTYLIFYSLS